MPICDSWSPAGTSSQRKQKNPFFRKSPRQKDKIKLKFVTSIYYLTYIFKVFESKIGELKPLKLTKDDVQNRLKRVVIAKKKKAVLKKVIKNIQKRSKKYRMKNQKMVRKIGEKRHKKGLKYCLRRKKRVKIHTKNRSNFKNLFTL